MDVTNENARFWDELCGSQLAEVLGITDNSPASLKKFDDWYFDFYPYLYKHIPFREMKDKDVLEVGLGYGTVTQKIAESGARYSGLDIAKGPVEMANHRLAQLHNSGKAIQGSILTPPFSSKSFDVIVAIGCLHHTGNLALAIENCRALLKPNGKLIFMVYYAFSYRRFRMVPLNTMRYAIREMLGYRGVVPAEASLERVAYDKNAEGEGAPHTDWISVKSLETLCSKFSSFRSELENIDQESPFSRTPRVELLGTRWPKYFGLDLYACAVK